MIETVNIICRYLPKRIAENVRIMQKSDIENLTEIRIRTGRPICITLWGESFCLGSDGTLKKESSECIRADFFEVNEILKALCHYSVYSRSREISEGFITLEGGIRAGLSGTLSQSEGQAKSVRYINGINFRVPRQVKGCADILYNRLLKNTPCSIIICGEVASGKTTVLRDLCRLCGNRYIVSLIDERGEIAGCRDGIPQNDVGINTDIFDGFDRTDGIVSAVRSMSPQIIFCDEVSTENDATSCRYGDF